ncbi:hypothetical protein [Rhodococcus sp. NPDC060176]|uniref:hypothetical protein n=1 Tax=Rhodococcus sp. NPDC060176 TaxID=3347062 RepID=UPI00364C660B
MSVDGFVFVDLETSGTSHGTDAIFELGLALYSRDLELVEHWQRLLVTSSTPHDLFRLRTEPQYDFVRGMHETNGLLAELDTKIAETGAENLPDGLGVYEAEAIDVLTRWGADDTTPLCGSSHRMDRAFLEVAMPKIDALFSYRIIDASSFWQFALVRRPELAAQRYARARSQMAGEHRVLGDIHNTVNLLRVFDGLDPVPFPTR